MGHSKAVPITSPPIKDESLIGYLIRIAGINAYESSAWTLRHAGLGYVDIKASTWKSRIPDLALVLGRSLDEIITLAPINTSEGNHSKVRLPNGEVISRYFFKWPTKAICSLCARENKYLSSLWDLRLVTHCPRHGGRLRQDCSECGGVARFYRTTLDFCKCARAKNNAATRLSESHVGLLRLLSNKYGGTNFNLQQYGFPSRILNATFKETIETVSLLGSFLEKGGDFDGRSYHYVKEENIVRQVAAAAEALTSWPNGFFRYMGRLLVSPENYSKPKFFANNLVYLYQTSSAHRSRVPVVFEGFEAYFHLLADAPTAIKIPKLQPSPGRHKWLVSASDTRKWLRTNHRNIDRLINEGHLKAIVSRRGNKIHRLITHESIDSYLDLKKRLIGAGAAAHMLSVSLHTLKTLVKAGFITPFHSPDLDGSHCWRFDQKVLEGFLHELEEHAAEFKLGPVLLIAAVKKYNKQGLSYVKLLSMIREGEVELLMYSRTERGFLKFGVDPEALNKLFSDEESPEQAKPGGVA